MSPSIFGAHQVSKVLTGAQHLLKTKGLIIANSELELNICQCNNPSREVNGSQRGLMGLKSFLCNNENRKIFGAVLGKGSTGAKHLC